MSTQISMLSVHRYVSQKIEASYGVLSFENFLRYVLVNLERYEKCHGGTGTGGTGNGGTGNGGTGNDISCRKQVDVHWRPYYQRCAYCDITYSFIGRMESFNEDVE